jgi:hypothetical protein
LKLRITGRLVGRDGSGAFVGVDGSSVVDATVVVGLSAGLGALGVVPLAAAFPPSDGDLARDPPLAVAARAGPAVETFDDELAAAVALGLRGCEPRGSKAPADAATGSPRNASTRHLTTSSSEPSTEPVSVTISAMSPRSISTVVTAATARDFEHARSYPQVMAQPRPPMAASAAIRREPRPTERHGFSVIIDCML